MLTAFSHPECGRGRVPRLVAPQLLLVAACVIATLLPLDAAAAGGDTEANRALVAAFLRDVFVARNPSAAGRYLSADYLQHNAKVPPGRDGFISALRDWFGHAPADLRDETLHLVADGDLVVAHQRFSYTGKDGKPVSVTGFDLYRVSGGRIVEHWDSDN